MTQRTSAHHIREVPWEGAIAPWEGAEGVIAPWEDAIAPLEGAVGVSHLSLKWKELSLLV